MAIALKLKSYLERNDVLYDTVRHRPTSCAVEAAEASRVPCEQLAKGVLVKRSGGYLLAVVPASRRLELDDIGEWLRQPVGLATEEEIAEIFGDCEKGAIPAVAAAYGVRTVVDESLTRQPDVYFEGGDRRTLVRVDRRSFNRLMAEVPMGRIGG